MVADIYFASYRIILAKHYGLTDKELDFIINYDIRYRMRLEGEEV